MPEITGLLERFLGPARARQQLIAHARQRGRADWRSLPPDAGFVHFAETELAAAIGSASARAVMAGVTREENP